MSSRVKEMVNEDRSPLKSKIESAVRSLQIQTQKLDKVSYSLIERDKTLFQKIVDAQATHDTVHANIYANELAELRKTEKTVSQSRLALEQVTLRIQTVREWGDLVASMAPVIGVIGNVKNAVSKVMPEAERELDYVGQSVSGLLMEAGEYTGGSLNLTSSSEEADKIMAEAAALSELKMKERFPEMPSSSASGEKT